jgi:hypothetical protein
MKITRITVWYVPLTSHVTYNMSDGKTCDTVESAVVRLDTDTGPVRLGRGLPDPALPAGLCPRRGTGLEEMRRCSGR